MQLAPTASTDVAPQHHKPVPIQPDVGSLRYTYTDGSTREFRIRPYIHEPTDFSERYASLQDAKRAIAEYNQDLLGVAFGIFQAQAGAFAIRPLESERGLPFVIDGSEVGARIPEGAALEGSSLIGIVGLRNWIDLRGAPSGTFQPVVPFPAG